VRYANLLFPSIGAALMLAAASGYADAADAVDVITEAFVNGIVKVDVSSNTAVFREEKNICKSEGTGFIISGSHVVTAEHVFKLDPACGQPVILLKSKRHSWQALAEVAGAEGDVGVLRTTKPFADGMCALRLRPDDLYNQSNSIRFGIPGGLADPEALQVKIGMKSSDFEPLVTLTPVATEFGESGGPVVYLFNVVGLTKAKHKDYTAYSFMITGSKIRETTEKRNIKYDGRTCNPVEVNSFPIGDRDAGASVKITLPDTAAFKIDNLFGGGASGPLAPNVLLGGSAPESNPTFSLEKNVATIRTNSPPSTTEISIAGITRRDPNKAKQVQTANANFINLTASRLSSFVEELLWSRYLEDGIKTGKVKKLPDAVLP
jgi:hypothetical protein